MTEFIPTIIPATITDYLMIQNMARFMTYEMSKYCGLGSEGWWMPASGLYECYDLKKYFDNNDHKVFTVKIGRELACFAIITKGTEPVDWLIEEFYIVGKFQGRGVAKSVAYQIWSDYPGNWELSVIPENMPALNFWRKTVKEIIHGNFAEDVRPVDYDNYQPTRVFLSFSI